MEKVMKPDRDVGIMGYGAYIPRYRLPAKAISELWRSGQDSGILPVKQKSVPGQDEDTVTMSVEAAQNAIKRAGINAQQINAVWIGSESHPYAVKPSGTIVAQILKITPDTIAGDLEFACKAGTEALQSAFAFVGSGMGRFALAIGMDTAQGRPGDALEYTAAAGGAAFICCHADKAIVKLEGSYSFVTDTPDFFRRAYQKYPEHGNRFTGIPSYFRHIKNSVQVLLSELNHTPEDYRYVVFHQPNTKFPLKVAKELGFNKEQMIDGLLAPEIGNTYAGSSVIGLTAVLDKVKPGERILVASFGSGAGSDAFSLIATNRIEEIRHKAPETKDYINRATLIDYGTYARWRKKIVQE